MLKKNHLLNPIVTTTHHKENENNSITTSAWTTLDNLEIETIKTKTNRQPSSLIQNN